MKDYRCRIVLTGPAGTPWHSDTIFGHLCWLVAYGALEMDIDAFLRPFKEGRPSFVLSDGFPAGLMPRPLLSPHLTQAGSLGEYNAFKRWHKAPYVTTDDFLRICEGKPPVERAVADPWNSFLVPHASLDRQTFTTGEEGNFFETSVSLLPPPGGLDLYVRAEEGWDGRVAGLLETLSRTGYGRDRSVGVGSFKVLEFKEWDRFRAVSNPTGAVSISSMVPAPHDPADARFVLRTKFGKLGEGKSGNPFKRPLLQMAPGAVFKAEPPSEFYGTLVERVAPGFPEAVQSGFGLMVACTG